MDGIARVRKKEKERKKEFNPVICTDNWRNEFIKNNSLRSGFSLDHQVQ